MRERLGLSRLGAPLVVGFFSLPLLALVVRAFADVWRAPALVPQRFGTRGFDVAFATGDAGIAFANSMIVALVTVTIGLALAWPAARVLGERRLRHPALVFTLLAMPFLVPPLAIGTGLTTWFIRLGLIDTLPGIVLAHLTAVLPYVVAILLSGFGPKVRELEEMARSLGASPRQRLAWVTVPAVRPTLAAATLLGFLVSWGQYGSTLAVGGGKPLLPLILQPFIGSDPEVAAALSLLFFVPAVGAIVVAARSARAPL